MARGPVAVVVPVYRQPEFLEGAVRSALDQRGLEGGARVVVVNDGCPSPDTHAIGERLAREAPDVVAYLRQENAGVSAARNAGIDLALDRWPDVRALFALDADNRLSPGTLAHLLDALDADPRLDWAVPALTLEGGEGPEVWQLPGPYTTYRQMFENQCDTGTLIRRDVFERGLRFDPTMRDGYEDWEFFLRAGLAGLRGAPAGECGFRYRRREGSMLADARARHEQVYGQVVERHRDAYAAPARTRREHAELPRWALVSPAGAEYLAAVDLEPRRVSAQQFAADVATSGGGTAPGPFVPGLVLAGDEALLEGLRASRLLAGVLLRLQAALRVRSVVALELRRHERPAGLDAQLVADWDEAGLAARAIPADAFCAHGSAAEPGRSLILRVGERLWPGPLPEPLAADALPAPGPPAATPASTPSVFSRIQHVERFDTTLPWAGEGGRHAALGAGEDAPEAFDTLTALGDLDAATRADIQAVLAR